MLTLTHYTLPTLWASYLVNGDPSSLTDDELNELVEWMQTEKPGICLSVSDDHWFAKSNDATWLGGDVATYTFEKDPTEYDSSHMSPTVAREKAQP